VRYESSLTPTTVTSYLVFHRSVEGPSKLLTMRTTAVSWALYALISVLVPVTVAAPPAAKPSQCRQTKVAILCVFFALQLDSGG